MPTSGSINNTTFDYPEDSVHVSGDFGAFVLAVRNDAGTPLAADGDYIPFTTDANGALRVSIVAAGGTFTTDYSYPEDSPHVSSDQGAFVLAVRNDTHAVLTDTDLDYSAIAVDSDGAVQISDGGNSITVDGTVTVLQGTSPWVVSATDLDIRNLVCGQDSVDACVTYDYAEDSVHVSGDIGAFVLAVRNDAGTPLAGDGDYIPFTTDSTGALRVNAGSLNVTYDYPEDSPHVSGDIGAFVLAVRNDANAALTDANGDYSPFSVTSTGALNIADAGGSITVDGTVTVLQGTSPWVVSGTVTADTNFDYPEDSPHVSGDVGAFVLAVRNDANAVLTSANGDYSPFSVTSSGALNIADAGGSITVDGTVTVLQGTSPWVVSGTVTADTNFDYPEDSVHVSGDVGAFTLGVRNDTATTLTSANGDYSPFATDAAGRIGIADLGGSISVDDNGGSLTVDFLGQFAEDSPHVSGDTGVFVLTVRNDANAAFTSANGDYSPIAVNSAGAVAIQDGGNSITVDGTVTVNQGTSPWIVSGTVTTQYQYAEDSGHTSGDIGAFVLAVRNDANAVLTSTNLDYSPFSVTSSGALNIADAGGSITVDGTVTVTQGTSPWVVSGTVTTQYQYAEDSASVSGDIGAFVLGVRNDTNVALTSANGDYGAIAVDQFGRVVTQFQEDNAHTSGDFGVMALTVRNDTHTTALTSANGDYSAIAVDSTGKVGIRSNFSEDSGHTSGDIGNFVLAVRNDAGTSLVDANLDYAPFSLDSTGALRVTSTASGVVTQFAEDAPHTSGDLGIQSLAVRNDTPGTLTSANGDYASFQQDGAGGIRVAGTIRHDDAITTATHSPILVAARAQDNSTTITSVAAGDVTFHLADLKGVQFVKEQRTQLLGIYYAGSGPHQLAAAADAANSGRVWLVNTSSTIAVALKEILYTCVSGTALVTLSFPRINVERFTFTGTPSGATITPAKRDSTDAANTGTLRTASTGMTITAGDTIKNFSPVTVLTAIGVSMPAEQSLKMQDHVDDRIVLRQNEGIVVRQADAGTVADTRRFFLDFRWEEYTL